MSANAELLTEARAAVATATRWKSAPMLRRLVERLADELEEADEAIVYLLTANEDER